MRAQVQTFWPSMSVITQRYGLALADKITAAGLMIFDDKSSFNFECTIDQTYIRQDKWWDPRKWTVDACQALNPMGLFKFICHLPAEPCEIKYNAARGLYMIAYGIPAITEIWLADGRHATGTINFPDAYSKRTSSGNWLVGPVETGTKTPDYFDFPDSNAA